MSATLRYRWLLPVGHLLLDVLVTLGCVWEAQSVFKMQKGALPANTLLRVSFSQDDSGVGWEPERIPPPPQEVLVASGTLPAGFISLWLRPDAWKQRRGRLWDPVWFLIHEAVGVPFWFVVGLLVDLGRLRLAKTMTGYLVARGIVAIVFVIWDAANFGVLVQFLFWLWFAGYAVVKPIAWLGQKARFGLRPTLGE